MADSIFLSGRKLAESLGESVWLEDRIVTEATSTARRIDDGPFDYALESAEHFPFARQSKHTAKTRREWARPLTLSQFRKQSCDILAILRARAGIARRVNPGRALKRIDFETGIVRDHQSGIPPGDRDCLQNRVLRESRAGFFDHRRLCFRRQIADLEFLAEDLGKFARLVRIACGDEQLAHRLK